MFLCGQPNMNLAKLMRLLRNMEHNMEHNMEKQQDERKRVKEDSLDFPGLLTQSSRITSIDFMGRNKGPMGADCRGIRNKIWKCRK